jgi:hypothetical protein
VFRNLRKLATGIAFVVILISISLAGCSTNSSQNPSSSSGQQSSTSSDQQSVDQSTQQQQPSSSGQQPSGDLNMTAILNRAAEILGISADEFTTAFQNAMPEGGASGSGQEGQPSAPPSGQEGQPPAPPSGQEGQPATPPSGEEGQPPAAPSGQQMSQSQFMTEIYEKMATELNISADDIAKAMEQAEKELQK